MRQITIKLLLVYGVATGAVIILSIIATIEFEVAFQWLGYLIMLIALSAIGVATRQYREQAPNGSLSFRSGLLIGLGITSIASVVYVFGWEAYLLVFGDEFWGSFSETLITSQGEVALSEAELIGMAADANALQEQYRNPLFRIPVTFLEVFPVGVVVSLVSAAISRR